MFEKYSNILDLIFQDFKIKSEVFELFALLHDSKRENEYEDEYKNIYFRPFSSSGENGQDNTYFYIPNTIKTY